MDYAHRRQRLLSQLDRPLVLFSGGLVARNYPANPFPFRADSNFLYFFERPEPESAACFDPGDRSVSLFLPERTVEGALWHGAIESFEEARTRHQVDGVFKVESLEAEVEHRAKGRQVDSLAVADRKTTARARAMTGEDLDFDEPEKMGRQAVRDAIAALRLVKSADELAAIRQLVPVTKEAHELAMRLSRAGVAEQVLAGEVEGAFARKGCVPAYGTILSVRGEVLHNHAHGNTLAQGDVVLLDAGAESAISGYCTDVTRAWPATGRFSPEARDVYEIVLKAEETSIEAVRPGVRFGDLHRRACGVLAEGLVAMGLLRGAPADLVESGAHAMFFPHGLGHQLGLDVHDLESFGDRVHYPHGRTRSTQFGTCFLRMDMDLCAGMTFTIEPGLYFVPAILRSPEFRTRFNGLVDFDRAERFLAMNGGRGFGGIRIEDDVTCTSSGAEVLTSSIAKRVAEIEQLVASA